MGSSQLNNYFHMNTIIDVDIFCKYAYSVPRWASSNGLEFIPVPIILISNPPLTKMLVKFKASPVILKMNKMTWYDWHIDEKRVCTINVLLVGENSKCFFGHHSAPGTLALDELVYTQGRCCLLDTTKKHAVLNMENTRYMLSLGFHSHTCYDEIMTYCKETEL